MKQAGNFTRDTECSPVVRFADHSDIIAGKRIADQHRDIFGFFPRMVFAEAVARRQLLVAIAASGEVVGFLRFNHRKRGTETALYDIGVDHRMLRQGIGRVLVAALLADCRTHDRTSIMLKCPEGLAAHAFYERLGFERSGVEAGRRRTLVVWQRDTEVEGWSS